MTGGVAAVVVAGGRGTRVGGDLPKQYRSVAGTTVLRRTLTAFTSHPGIAAVQPVIHPDDEGRFAEAAAGLAVLRPAHGGATRQASVLAGLEALADRAPDIVLVHDAARPFASPALLDRAIAAGRTGAAIPGLAVSDTVKVVDGAGRVAETLDRSRLRTVQTPQAFVYPALLAAHRKAAAAGRHDFTDDAALAEWAGLSVAVFEGEPGNVKLTTADDFRRAEAELLAGLGDVRVGSGYDVHAFTEGDHVWLGGVKVPHTQGVSGHSDADVVLHALVDAVLGALAEGDIGVHFPPSDPQWKGASSDRFLAYAIERVKARGGLIAHLDVAVVCEAPRLGPHREAMRARIAEIAGVSIDRVGLQATTSEKMGFIGRSEGLVAYATATVRLPWATP
ncbi:Bifunctional enzyme IspD/IspF [Rhodoplanes serenus]|uniref:Bifunctional enzyme IspD/IspF n=1 Tax=Rhodoplanes serenus TaxID=200615 RepID=A0A447D1D9_9BRAD|nr:bifunctional 2-C-methyl-D-erythritol 4-phosphate cytidylyltransferase/2-C-methyl-D-erythritol 2,4-cyclodiphosphate synthase [Rhodoplanes serenus]VCU11355.1 Bifunctional enzyme IspD/IspF [Rhodoplanes serenus]